MHNDRIWAHLTALTMLVESLVVEDLAKDESPRRIANDIINARFEDEAALSAAYGGAEQKMEVTRILTELLDRAVARAESLRASGHHD